MDCEQVREQLEAYALGALEPDERDRVARHLAGCPECRRLAAAYAEVAADLPLALAAASPLRPPPELKERLVRPPERDARQGARAQCRVQGPRRPAGGRAGCGRFAEDGQGRPASASGHDLTRLRQALHAPRPAERRRDGRETRPAAARPGL